MIINLLNEKNKNWDIVKLEGSSRPLSNYLAWKLYNLFYQLPKIESKSFDFWELKEFVNLYDHLENINFFELLKNDYNNENLNQTIEDFILMDYDGAEKNLPELIEVVKNRLIDINNGELF